MVVNCLQKNKFTFLLFALIVLNTAQSEAQNARPTPAPTPQSYSIEGSGEDYNVNEEVIVIRRGNMLRTLVFSLPALCQNSSTGESYESNLIYSELDRLRHRITNNRSRFSILLDPITNAGLLGNAEITVVFRNANTARITIEADAAEGTIQCGFTASYTLRRIRRR